MLRFENVCEEAIISLVGGNTQLGTLEGNMAGEGPSTAYETDREQDLAGSGGDRGDVTGLILQQDLPLH